MCRYNWYDSINQTSQNLNIISNWLDQKMIQNESCGYTQFHFCPAPLSLFYFAFGLGWIKVSVTVTHISMCIISHALTHKFHEKTL